MAEDQNRKQFVSSLQPCGLWTSSFYIRWKPTIDVETWAPLQIYSLFRWEPLPQSFLAVFVRWPRQWTLALLCTYRCMLCTTDGGKCTCIYSHGPLTVGKSNMLWSVKETHHSPVLQLCLRLALCLDQTLLLFSGWTGLHVQDRRAMTSANPFEL